MSILALALTFFLVANPIGNSPTILALLKNCDFARQRKIMFRESIFSMLLAFFFQFFGEVFLKLLHISHSALTLTGGLILLMTALSMIFQEPEDVAKPQSKREPFIVPIATPLLSGAGLMTMIMVSAAAEPSNLKISLAILIAWFGVTIVLVTAPYLQKVMGKRGMSALEQIMAMLLGLMSFEMLIKGLDLFLKSLEPGSQGIL